MASVNKAIILGNCARDAEIRHSADGSAIANLSIATNETWKDKSGEKQERTEWHKVSLFGKLAEIAGEYVKKGSAIYIEGRIQTRKWQDKEGNDRYTTEIVGDRMQLLGGKRDEPPQPIAANPAQPAKPAGKPPGKHAFDDFEDDVP